MRLGFSVVFLPLVCVGCGPPYRVAPVSGRITLDGKPLANALVTFAPMGTKGQMEVGPTAAARTDADGRYALKIDPKKPGAVVGHCRIYINTPLDERAKAAAKEPPPDVGALPGQQFAKDRLPERYRYGTELTFDVPTSGTDSANFALSSK
jgi:hypothetical protein